MTKAAHAPSIASMAYDASKKAYVFETRFVAFPDGEINWVDYLEPGSWEVVTNQSPSFSPHEVNATEESSSPMVSHLKGRDLGTQSAGSVEQRIRSWPVVMGRIPANRMKQLLKKTDGRGNLKTAPRASVTLGETATISDSSNRPFVVGLTPVKSEQGVQMQPQLQHFEEGTMLRLVLTNDDQQLRLHGDIAMAEVSDVETYEFPSLSGDKEESQMRIQVPTQSVRLTHFSTLVNEGETLFVDANIMNQSAEVYRKHPLAAPRTRQVQTKLYALITVRKISAQSERLSQRTEADAPPIAASRTYTRQSLPGSAGQQR